MKEERTGPAGRCWNGPAVRGVLLRAVLVIAFWATAGAPAADWVRGGTDGKQPMWGLRGGVQFAIHPAIRGPRGLIRVLYPTLAGGRYDLINFIAVEPIVRGKRGFSELEPSRLDDAIGKRFRVEPEELQGNSRGSAKRSRPSRL